MMKRIIAIAIAFCLLAGYTQPVFAMISGTYRGFTNWGSMSNSIVSFGFEADEVIIVYNREVTAGGSTNAGPDYYNIYTGSSIYIPVNILDSNSTVSSIATERQVRDNQVQVSWKGKQGDRYIDSVTLVDARRERIDGLTGGMYAKIQLNSSYMSQGPALVEVDAVLSVRRLSYPETMVTLRMDMVNREVNIDRNTVYTVQAPTQFNVMRSFRADDVTFDFGSGVRYTVRVEPQERFFLNLDREQDPVITDMYPDSYIEYYNFLGDRDTFGSSGSLEIPIDRSLFVARGSERPQVYVYQVTGNYILSALDESVLSFDSRRDTLTIRTNSLDYYILSDQPLHREIEDDTDEIIYVGYAPNEPEIEDDDGNESGFINQNPVSGPGSDYNINADNRPASNPPTSDRPLAPIVLIMLTAAMTALAVWKKGIFGL